MIDTPLYSDYSPFMQELDNYRVKLELHCIVCPFILVLSGLLSAFYFQRMAFRIIKNPFNNI